MKSWKTPTPEQLAKIVPRLSHVEQYRYFFDRLENPLWITPLKKHGFLTRAPAPVSGDAAGTIRFPPWPDSRYLARMAPHAPELVLQTALQVQDMGNVGVRQDILDAAVAMPSDVAVLLVPKIKEWLKSGDRLPVLTKLGELMVGLAQGGQGEAALEIAKAALVVLPDPQAAETAAKPERRGLSPEPTARIDDWAYRDLLKTFVAEVVPTAGLQALRVLCSLLRAAIRHSQSHDGNAGSEDYSWIWRPAIERHSQNLPHGLRDALVTAMREAAEQIAGREPSAVPEIVHLLQTMRYPVFLRLALYLLHVFPDAAPELVHERLTDPALFKDPRLHHEYALLLQSRFGHLHEEDQATILGWIERGPDDEEVNADRWRLTRLALISANLSDDSRQRYTDLVTALGEVEHPDFLSYTKSLQGPNSPRSPDELRSMSITDLVAFLHSWEPEGQLWQAVDGSNQLHFDSFGPSREGLGRVVSSLVTADPERFAVEADRFQELDPTYVRALLFGLREASSKQMFGWDAALRLCRWAVEQPRHVAGRVVHYFGQDPDWGWARKAVADLLFAGFRAVSAEIPFGLRQEAWAALRPATDDPDPTPEDEARYGGSNMDPATLSVNTTRGAALHAVVQYALWVRRHLEKTDPEAVARRFEAMPEVREVLERHLDSDRDPSLAVRAVYGQWFPWLALLDPGWAEQNVARIFPQEQALRELCDAAWETYLAFNSAYDNVFQVLRGEYEREIGRIGAPAPDHRRLADPDKQLGEHLMALYWRGKLQFDEPGGQLERFFAVAPDALRGQAVEFVGRTLYHEKEAIPSEILGRLEALWEWRLASARDDGSGPPHIRELAAFGWWFASAKFDDGWSIAQLEDVLPLQGPFETVHLVVERLAALATAMPERAVRCLDQLIASDKQGWGIYGWRGHAREILAAAMRNTDNAAQGQAEAIIDRLGRKGFVEFRDLLVRAR